MTQAKVMTNTEINRKLAELMGYTIFKGDGHNYMLLDPNGDRISEYFYSEDNAWAKAPDYCTDPAASLEVQTAAIKVSTRYVDTLVEVMKPENMAYSRACVAELLTASPRERTEAAYITLQGAVGDESS